VKRKTERDRDRHRETDRDRKTGVFTHSQFYFHLQYFHFHFCHRCHHFSLSNKLPSPALWAPIHVYLVLFPAFSQRSPVPTYIPVFYGILVPRFVPLCEALPYSTVRYRTVDFNPDPSLLLVLASTTVDRALLLLPIRCCHTATTRCRHSTFDIRQPTALALSLDRAVWLPVAPPSQPDYATLIPPRSEVGRNQPSYITCPSPLWGSTSPV
jgi:hypothetical protein